MLKNFGTISISFFISNLLVSHIFAGIIILGLIFIFISFVSLKLASIFSIILNLLLQLLISISEICSNIPLSKIYFIIPSDFFIFSYYLIAFNFIYFKNLSRLRKNRIKKKIIQNKQKIIALFLIVILILSFIKIIPKNLRIYFIDVGQRRWFINNYTTRKKYFNRWWQWGNGRF